MAIISLACQQIRARFPGCAEATQVALDKLNQLVATVSRPAAVGLVSAGWEATVGGAMSGARSSSPVLPASSACIDHRRPALRPAYDGSRLVGSSISCGVIERRRCVRRRRDGQQPKCRLCSAHVLDEHLACRLRSTPAHPLGGNPSRQPAHRCRERLADPGGRDGTDHPSGAHLAKMPPQRRLIGARIPRQIVRELNWLRATAPMPPASKLMHELGLDPWTALSGVNQFAIQQQLSDFRVIKNKGRVFAPDDYNQIHNSCLRYLKQELPENNCEQSIVVTHHVPTMLNYPEKYKGSILKCGFRC